MASVSVLIVPELWILLGKCLPAVYTIWVTMKSLSKAAWTPAGADLIIARTCFYRYKIGPDSSGADGGVPKTAILYSHPPCSPCWLRGLAGRNLGWGALSSPRSQCRNVGDGESWWGHFISVWPVGPANDNGRFSSAGVCGTHFLGGRNIWDLKTEAFQVPINASEVIFGGVSHLFLLGILLPESHTVGLVQPDSVLSYFGFTLL